MRLCTVFLFLAVLGLQTSFSQGLLGGVFENVPEPCITFEYDDNGNRISATLDLCGGLLDNNLVDSTQEQMVMELDSSLFFGSDTSFASTAGDQTATLAADDRTGEPNLSNSTNDIQASEEAKTDNTVKVAVMVYPNPVIGLLNITCSADREFSYRITSLSGSKVFRQGKVSSGRTAVDVSMLAAGNYLVSVTMDDEYKVFQITVQ